MRGTFRVVFGGAEFVWLQAEQGGDATRQTEDWTAVVREERVMLCPNAEVGWQFVTSTRFPPISFDPVPSVITPDARDHRFNLLTCLNRPVKRQFFD